MKSYILTTKIFYSSKIQFYFYIEAIILYVIKHIIRYLNTV